MAITDVSTVTKTERRKMMQALQGTAFDPHQRVFGAFEGGTVFDFGEFETAQIATMLREDGKARSLEQVLTLPLRGAQWKLEAAEGDSGELKLVQDNLGDRLGKIIDQMTTAVAYRKAYFETNWTLDNGRVVYDQIAWRPPTGCEAGFDPNTGEPRGFRQRIPGIPGALPNSITQPVPGYITVTPSRAFIYTHGAYRDPIRGVSDLDVACWCWENKRKVLYLWFDHLQSTALPKTVVYGPDIDEAEARAESVASLRNSGVLGLPYPTEAGGAKAFEVLESGGQGAAQFYQAVQYLESLMTSSVLASFTDLPQAAVQGVGSYALSADQSEFFLASRQAVADEMADSLVQDLFGPLCRYNFGPDAALPKLTIGPLSSRYQQRSLDLLQAIVGSRYANVPRDFVDSLVTNVASYLGLDEEKVRAAIQADQKAAQEQQAQTQALQQQPPTGQPPGQPGRPPQPPAGKGGKGEQGLYPVPQAALGLSRAVRLADELVLRASNGEDPAVVLADLTDTS